MGAQDVGVDGYTAEEWQVLIERFGVASLAWLLELMFASMVQHPQRVGACQVSSRQTQCLLGTLSTMHAILRVSLRQTIRTLVVPCAASRLAYVWNIRF
jgi:hypothetical protein